MVTPQVQTATSSHRISEHSHQTAYERALALGLGVALALVAALALMVPTGGAAATAAHGKATPHITAVSTQAGDGSTSVE